MTAAKKVKAKPAAKKVAAKKVAAKKQVAEKKASADVYMNGKYVFTTNEPEKFVDDVRKKRRMNLLSDQLNVAHYPHLGEVSINTGHGKQGQYT